MEALQKDILAILEADSRVPVGRLAAMLGVDEERVKDEIKKLEEQGTIVKYTAILNSDELDENKVEALIEVKVTPQKGEGFDAIASEIAAHGEVKNLYLMSGGYDLAVIVEGNSLKSVARFVSEKISTYETVISTATHFILKKYKVEGALIKKSEEGRLSVQP